MQFRVASVQFKPDMGRIAHNLDRIAEIVSQASADERADLVVFPETAVSGYYLKGAAMENALDAEDLRHELAKRMGGVKQPVDVLIGFYEKPNGKPFNSASYYEFSPGSSKTVGVYRKFFLPTYTVFDEERYVARGTELGLFDTRFGKVGILICEDAWHSILGTLLAIHGADLICTLIASPGRGLQGAEPSNVERYERMVRAVSEEHGLFSVSSMLTGFEGGKGLVGGSVIYDPFGVQLAKGDILDEHLVVADLDKELIALARNKTPLLEDLKESWDRILRLAKK